MRQRSKQFKKIILLCGVMFAFLMARCPLAGALFVQQTKLTADVESSPDYFGKSVAVSGDTAVIGLTGGVSNKGGAFIFTRQPDGTWVQSAKLFTSDSLAKDYFGISVAIDGDTVVIGASGKNNYKGAAYVFAKPPGGWQDMTQTAKLTASDGQEGDYFGWSVAVSGNTVIAGAYADDILSKSGQYLVNKKDRGSAYVFVKQGSNWSNMTESAKLTASDGQEDDFFGRSVAVSGDTIVAGAPYDNIGTSENAGSAYVFVKPDGGWTGYLNQTAKLTLANTVGGEIFGCSVAIDANTVAIGARSVIGYVMVKPPDGWTDMTQSAKLTASDAAVYETSIAVSGNTIVIGNNTQEVSRGAAYVFAMPESGWADMSESQKLTALDGSNGDEFGWSVAISGDTVMAGAPFDTVTEDDQGSAYVFERESEPVSTTTTTTDTSSSSSSSSSSVGSTTSSTTSSAPESSTTTTAPEEQQRPKITSAPETEATVFTPYLYDVNTDVQADNMTFALSAGPEGMEIEAMTGVIAWIPRLRDIGEHDVVVTVSDNGGLSDIQDFKLTVALSKRGCPAQEAVGDNPLAVALLRQFRDSVLVLLPEGATGTQWYNRNRRALFGLISADPALKQTSADIIYDLLPALENRLEGKPATVSQTILIASTGFLRSWQKVQPVIALQVFKTCAGNFKTGKYSSVWG